MAAILAAIFQYLPSAVIGIEELIAFIGKAKATLQQTGEWTPDLEIAFLEALIARARNDPRYQPDPSRTVIPTPTIVPPDTGNAA